jgi:hypothetical protein
MTIESIGIIVGFAVLLGGIVFYLVRERGTEGPPVGNVPRFMHKWVNAWHAVNKWPIPFDRDGNLIPVDQRKRATDT